MSVNIPSGSSNPIGHKMPPPDTPVPLPSGETKDAIQKALHERDAPSYLVGEGDEIRKKGLGGVPGEEQSVKGTGIDEPGSTMKEGEAGERKS